MVCKGEPGDSLAKSRFEIALATGGGLQPQGVRHSAAEEEVLEQINSSISVLERSVAALQPANGQVGSANSLNQNLLSQLNKQLSVRREQREQLSRESSVIQPLVRTSTPNLSPNPSSGVTFPGFFPPEVESAGVSSVSVSDPPPLSVPQPGAGADFNIYRDPSLNLPSNHVRKIPVITTPSTAFDVTGQENVFPFSPRVIVTQYTVQESGMTHDETQELDRAVDAEVVKEAIKKLAKNCSKLKNFCTLYQS